MIRRLIILLLIVGCVFGEDELKDRRVISFNMIASPRDLAIEDSDRTKAIVRKGESKKIEFKQSLSLDIKTNKKEKYIEHSILKTICAFFNSSGGILLVGISDDGEFTGVDKEIDKLYKSNSDRYLLHFKNLIKDTLGPGVYPIIEYSLVKIDSKNILMVECQKSELPTYLNDKEFYVRTNPATDKLEGPELVKYINTHFK